MMCPMVKVHVWGNIPKYKSTLAAGADLYAYLSTPVVVEPMERVLIHTNTYVAIPEGYEGQVRPRSGLSYKHGITLINAVGTIDADYRGEICVPIINLGDTSYTIENGVRIAQLVIAPCVSAQFILNQNLEDLPSGEKYTRKQDGFGSTGMR